MAKSRIHTDSLYQNIIKWCGNTFDYDEFIEYLKIQETKETIEDWEKDIYSFSLEWLSSKKNTFDIQTSGSTGNPKTIILQRTAMIDSAKATGKALDLQNGDTALISLPAKFIAGKMMIVRALVLGLDLYILKPTVDVISHIKTPITFCAFIPLQLQYAIDNQLNQQLNKLDTIIVGGAPLPQDYVNQLGALKPQIYATYGMTETITHIALKRLNGHEKTDSFHCLDLYRVALDDRGCLVVKIGKEEFITNDLATLYSSTQFNILGRIDFVINSGGLKINPEEIEGRIGHLIDSPFMISYKADAHLGQKLVLLIEESTDIINESDLLRKIIQVLPANKSPKEIVFVKTLYFTPNHKIDRYRNILVYVTQAS
ncbi:MAG: AMP-binding protein [Bacteroidales bacterium]|nr:AMP-binding protein [Bacteroidales bacterium]